ncbi:AbiTii domain-containing protein [Bacillus thuringiensis]
MAKDRNKEALDLSEEILRNFELREIPTQNIVLKCLRLARLIHDFDSVEWLKQEANGFERTEEGYIANAAWSAAAKSGRRYFIDDPKGDPEKPERVERAFTQTIAVMEAAVDAAKARMGVAYDRNVSISSQSTFLPPIPQGNANERNAIANIIRDNTEKIETVKSKLYEFVLNVNYELKFGDITEDIFTRKRKSVDTTLKDICPEAIQKFISVYENLKSDNDEDWANAVHTCRRIIKDVADSLYPPSNEPIQLPGGKTRKIGEDQYINRLIQYIDSKSTSEKFSAIVGSHLKFIGERLDGVHEAANKGTHAEVTLDEAERYIIYTYLVIGDILSL